MPRCGTRTHENGLHQSSVFGAASVQNRERQRAGRLRQSASTTRSLTVAALTGLFSKQSAMPLNDPRAHENVFELDWVIEVFRRFRPSEGCRQKLCGPGSCPVRFPVLPKSNPKPGPIRVNIRPRMFCSANAFGWVFPHLAQRTGQEPGPHKKPGDGADYLFGRCFPNRCAFFS